MNLETTFIRLRGLPFAAKEADVREFLQGIAAESITFTLTPSGRASGECYVELGDVDDVKEALKLDRNEISGRYIEVFAVPQSELSMMIHHGIIRRKGEPESRYASNFVVRLRGLPYSATVDDIKSFFKGLDVCDVVIDKEQGGRPSGEAFVRLATKEHAELALERSRNNMGTRYIEVFRSSDEEMDNSYYTSRGIPPPLSGPVPLRGLNLAPELRYGGGYMNRFGGALLRGGMNYVRHSPYDRRYAHHRYEPNDFDEFDYDAAAKVYMRGLPYNVTAIDIEQFFKPLNCVEIKLGYNDDRRLSGDGIVLFSTMAEAHDALSRNKNNIGSRYIELFPGTSVPYPTKYTTFRLVGGTGPSGRGPFGRYTSFADDDDYVGYGFGGQQFYNDQYEGRQSRYSAREWGEPARSGPMW
ncbi:unnamed protein product [Anisakis simplex]|uniref:Heterogeneous nuclear ribonucleoprotein F n=1 Tax=Anisakis simplex TaxID=6269 RepID=A0A0M3JVE8_ANISI|nr:unnamed protein product [Anisakis simplex]